MSGIFRKQAFVENLCADGVVDSIVSEELARYSASDLLNRLQNREDVNQERVVELLAGALHIPFVPETDLKIDEELRPLLSRYNPEQLPILPLARDFDGIHVAVSNPFDIELQDRLEILFEEPVRLFLASSAAISRVLDAASSGSDRLQHLTRGLPDKKTKGNAASAIEAEAEVDESSAPVVKLVNTILREAAAKGASDIHIEFQPPVTTIRYRLDGILHLMMEPLEGGYHGALVSRVKVMAELDIAEHRIPQDGRFAMEIADRDVDFRVSVLPGLDKEAVVIRILDQHAVPGELEGLNLANLGLPSATLKRFRRIVAQPNGMVLVTGPTGSGKTTTLYAALNEFDKNSEKIITIEDPVEYKLPGILQIPVNEKKGLTFATGLRSILRHDPDRIMVGEIRDRETAEIAVQSALTGHLVLTTVHANGCLDVIHRLKFIGVNAKSFVQSLNGVLAQRLLRNLCPSCKRPVANPAASLEDYGITNMSEVSELYEAGGCKECGFTGYRGRTLVSEFLLLSPRLKQALSEERPLLEVEKIAKEEGWSPLKESALEKAYGGVTSLHEINRVTGVN